MLKRNRSLGNIVSLVLLLGLVPAGARAQSAVGELVGRMPAQNAAEADSIHAALLTSGPAGMREVCGMLVPPGGGDDAKARYAISGLAKYVTRPGAEAERKVFAAALVDALASAADKQVKAFLMSQLQLTGKDESVAPLSGYLKDAELCEPAVQALLAIRTPAAEEAIAASLPTASGPQRVTVIKALGELRRKASADEIAKYASSEDRNTRLTALYALADIGDPSSSKVLAQAQKTASASERAEVTSLRLLHAKRLAENGRKREGAAICRELVRSRDQEVNVRCAALSTLAAIKGKGSLSELLAAVGNDSIELRAAALASAPSAPGKSATKKWVKKMKKVSPEARCEIMDMLGRRGDVAALPALLEALDDTEPAVQSAAVGAAVRLDPGKTLDAVLEDLTRDDKAERAPSIRALSAWPDYSGFLHLFNGADLAGWAGDTTGYVVENGSIVCKPGGNLYTEGEFGDFVFRFEFKLAPGSNNGLALRAPIGGGAYNGMELQILDDTDGQYKDLHPYQYHGSIYGVVPAERGHLKPVGEWNSEEVIANARRIVVNLNGVTTVDADIEKASTPKTMDGKEHVGLLNEKGHLGFLGHGTVVEFRNIRIMKLK